MHSHPHPSTTHPTSRFPLGRPGLLAREWNGMTTCCWSDEALAALQHLTRDGRVAIDGDASDAVVRCVAQAVNMKSQVRGGIWRNGWDKYFLSRAGGWGLGHGCTVGERRVQFPSTTQTLHGLPHLSNQLGWLRKVSMLVLICFYIPAPNGVFGF